MRCKNCGREIDNLWGFCPHCGFFADGFEDNFMNVARMLGGKAVIKQDGDSFIVILEVQGTRHAFRITPLDLEEVAPSLAPSVSSPQPEQPPQPRRAREYERTEEPETEINQVQNKIYIKIDLSGIAQEDIEIDELEDSIEVRAYKGKTRYFKLIPTPKEYYIISKEFLPEEVIITLEKE